MWSAVVGFPACGVSSAESWLVSPQLALCRQLQLVLPPFWNAPVSHPLRNRGLRTTKGPSSAQLRSKMSNNFLRGHAPLSDFRFMRSIGSLIE